MEKIEFSYFSVLGVWIRILIAFIAIASVYVALFAVKNIDASFSLGLTLSAVIFCIILSILFFIMYKVYKIDQFKHLGVAVFDLEGVALKVYKKSYYFRFDEIESVSQYRPYKWRLPYPESIIIRTATEKVRLHSYLDEMTDADKRIRKSQKESPLHLDSQISARNRREYEKVSLLHFYFRLCALTNTAP